MRIDQRMSETARLVTAEELEHYPDDDYRYELVEGRLLRVSPVGFEHGRVVVQVVSLLHRHLYGKGIGAALTEVGFKLASNPDTVRAPDIAFVRQARIAKSTPRGFLHGPPDLVIEVLSPDDRPSEVEAKVVEYLACGAPLVLVIDPDARTVVCHRRSAAPVTFRDERDVIDLDDVVPGFRCEVREIFE